MNSLNALAESRLIYNFDNNEMHLVCVDEKLWVYTLIGLDIESTTTKNPFYDITTETRGGIDQKKCSTGI